jgi:predicted dehydrogenase
LKIAIIGLGVMGQNHLRVLESMRSVEIVALVDQQQEHVEKLAQRLGCLAFQNVSNLVGMVDAAIVAAPSVHHYEIGSFLLGNGIHCLIEKPLAVEEEQCQELIEIAERTGTTLMVGHIEQFNPAVQQLKTYLNGDIHPNACLARRVGIGGQRITDTDVVADLMIHDIDVVLSFAGSKVHTVQAHASRAKGVSRGDHVSALIGFESGFSATLIASRVTTNWAREMQVTTDKGALLLNYKAQELFLFQNGMSHAGGSERLPLDYAASRFVVRPAEPLAAELSHFVDCVKHRKKPLIDGKDALDALRVVWAIQQAIR